jgi:general secretion pathway protein H
VARGRKAFGFTLLELLAALAIAGLVLAVSVPASVRMYESMQYRQAVRDVITLFSSALYKAIQSGYAQSV